MDHDDENKDSNTAKITRECKQLLRSLSDKDVDVKSTVAFLERCVTEDASDETWWNICEMAVYCSRVPLLERCINRKRAHGSASFTRTIPKKDYSLLEVASSQHVTSSCFLRVWKEAVSEVKCASELLFVGHLQSSGGFPARYFANAIAYLPIGDNNLYAITQEVRKLPNRATAAVPCIPFVDRCIISRCILNSSRNRDLMNRLYGKSIVDHVDLSLYE